MFDINVRNRRQKYLTSVGFDVLQTVLAILDLGPGYKFLALCDGGIKYNKTELIFFSYTIIFQMLHLGILLLNSSFFSRQCIFTTMPKDGMLICLLSRFFRKVRTLFTKNTKYVWFNTSTTCQTISYPSCVVSCPKQLFALLETKFLAA